MKRSAGIHNGGLEQWQRWRSSEEASVMDVERRSPVNFTDKKIAEALAIYMILLYNTIIDYREEAMV